MGPAAVREVAHAADNEAKRREKAEKAGSPFLDVAGQYAPQPAILPGTAGPTMDRSLNFQAQPAGENPLMRIHSRNRSGRKLAAGATITGFLICSAFARMTAGHESPAPGANQTATPVSQSDDSSVIAGRTEPVVGTPPASFFETVRERDRQTAREFYAKFVDVQGLPVVAAADVADEALQRTHELVSHLLAGRPDVLAAMVQNGTRLIIIGKDQVYTDMPEYRNRPNPAYLNERVRGTGGFDVTSFGEENLLNLPLDRYDDESIAVHEFCHTIDAALNRIDPAWNERLRRTYRHAIEGGRWKNAYAASNAGEYWAEICQCYFDCNRINNWNHASIGTREQLQDYDPAGFDLVQTTFRLTPENDWRYKPLRRQPSVIPPPDRFKIDPYYTKFTNAREFTVLGSTHASDAALLKANDTIRKMFAYRHDILKAIIADGARLVVLGRDDQLGDLPEFQDTAKQADLGKNRYVDYSPAGKLIVVPEENIVGIPGQPSAGECLVIAALAKCMLQITGMRPVDPEFDRRRDKQQYELRVTRMDVEFDRKLARAFDAATQKGLWKVTPAARNRVEYLAAGVQAYFDAAGESSSPDLAERPTVTREALKAYDPELFALVEETMAYKGHTDWRFRR
jgi:alpha-glucosidase